MDNNVEKKLNFLISNPANHVALKQIFDPFGLKSTEYLLGMWMNNSQLVLKNLSNRHKDEINKLYNKVKLHDD